MITAKRNFNRSTLRYKINRAYDEADLESATLLEITYNKKAQLNNDGSINELHIDFFTDSSIKQALLILDATNLFINYKD